MLRLLILFILLSGNLFSDWENWDKADPLVINKYNDRLQMKREGHALLFEYIDKSNNVIELNGDLGALNTFLLDTIKNKQESSVYIKNSLPNLLLYCLGKWGSVICYINDHDNDINNYASYIYYSNNKYIPFESILDICNKHISNKEIKIPDENRWILNASILTALGGLEEWSIKGTIYPLQITIINRKVIIPSGRTYPEDIK